MNRQQAEKLLAAAIFDELDDASKAELLAYLQTDDELREHMADMRMGVKLTRDAVNEGPEPTLNTTRLKRLERLAQATQPGRRFGPFHPLASAAVILITCVLLMTFLSPSLNRVRRYAGTSTEPASASIELDQRMEENRSLRAADEDLSGDVAGGTSFNYRLNENSAVAMAGGYGGDGGNGGYGAGNGEIARGYGQEYGGATTSYETLPDGAPLRMTRPPDVTTSNIETRTARRAPAAERMIDGNHSIATESDPTVVASSAGSMSSVTERLDTLETPSAVVAQSKEKAEMADMIKALEEIQNSSVFSDNRGPARPAMAAPPATPPVPTTESTRRLANAVPSQPSNQPGAVVGIDAADEEWVGQSQRQIAQLDTRTRASLTLSDRAATNRRNATGSAAEAPEGLSMGDLELGDKYYWMATEASVQNDMGRPGPVSWESLDQSQRQIAQLGTRPDGMVSGRMSATDDSPIPYYEATDMDADRATTLEESAGERLYANSSNGAQPRSGGMMAGARGGMGGFGAGMAGGAAGMSAGVGTAPTTARAPMPSQPARQANEASTEYAQRIARERALQAQSGRGGRGGAIAATPVPAPPSLGTTSEYAEQAGATVRGRTSGRAAGPVAVVETPPPVSEPRDARANGRDIVLQPQDSFAVASDPVGVLRDSYTPAQSTIADEPLGRQEHNALVGSDTSAAFVGTPPNTTAPSSVVVIAGKDISDGEEAVEVPGQTKVPGLGDTPLLGTLFKREADVANDTADKEDLVETYPQWRAGREAVEAKENLTAGPGDREYDTPVAGGADVRAYQLDNAAASNVAALINELFGKEAQGARVQFGGRGARGAEAGNEASAAVDEQTNSIVVTGPPEILSAIDQIVRDLDKAPVAATVKAQVANEDAGDIELVMNFQNAPLEQVFEYLSEMASLTVVAPQAAMGGRMTMISRQPVTVDEAVAQINAVLGDRNLTAVRLGNSLRVVTTDQARSNSVPVLVGADVNALLPNDDVVTVVLPIRHSDAQVLSQVVKAMSPGQTLVEANPDSNTVIVTDSASNVQSMTKIVQALDAPTSEEAEIRVYQLQHAAAGSVARLVDEIFQGEAQRRGRTALATAANEQTNTLVVAGPIELLTAIHQVVADLDNEPAEAAPPTQVASEDPSDIPAASRFKVVPVNPWVMTQADAQSTFALDVDTASYALCRRYIRSGYLPPIGAVRMEEFINAFDYAYPQREAPTFAVYADGAPSPFAPAGRDVTLLKIAVKARTVGRDQRRPAHLVFVVDASASMGQPDRLGAVQSALEMLVDQLSDNDRVSLVTCAESARLHANAIPATQKSRIRQLIASIQPAGPTNLLAGLELGYAIARRSFAPGQINQVILCSDGVANVGQVEAEAVLEKVAEDRKQAITLTCVGVGYGAYNDSFLEALANRGDGRYVFLDPTPEAQETLVGQLADTLQTVAQDARIQVEFDPARVRRYRLVGYENRDIADASFRDDTIDAGEVGSGQCSTALYELELTDPADRRSELGTVFVRYRNTDTGAMEEIAQALSSSMVRRRNVTDDPRFFLAAGVARFAEWLRQSEHARDTQLADIQSLLDDVYAALPLDSNIKELTELAYAAENLPRAP